MNLSKSSTAVCSNGFATGGPSNKKAMYQCVILGVVVLGLMACSNSDQKAAQANGQTTADVKFDLKGLWAGMPKDEIEKVIGTLECLPSVQLIQNMDAAVGAAEKVLAQAKLAGLTEGASSTPPAPTQAPASSTAPLSVGDPSLLSKETPPIAPPQDVIDNARNTLKIKSSGQLEVFRQLYTKTLDTTCRVRESAALTYGNLPASIEVGLKSGKSRMIEFNVRGDSDNSILQGLAIKYKWVDPQDTSQPLQVQLMQLYLSLAQGVVDNRGNTLFLSQGSIPQSVVLTIVDAGFKADRLSAIADSQKAKTGVKDM